MLYTSLRAKEIVDSADYLNRVVTFTPALFLGEVCPKMGEKKKSSNNPL